LVPDKDENSLLLPLLLRCLIRLKNPEKDFSFSAVLNQEDEFESLDWKKGKRYLMKELII